MGRRGLSSVLVVVLLVALAQLGPVAADPHPDPDLFLGDRIAVELRGTATNTSTEPSRMTFTAPLYSLATGRQVGTATDSFTCVTPSGPPCLVVEATTTFSLPRGEIVNRMLVSAAPDPRRTGWVLTGARPTEGTIVSGTGVYEGRTGRTRLSGTVDASGLPQRATFDDWWVLELDPRRG